MVWIDSNCDGRKEFSETPLSNKTIVQFVNTGADRVLNSGDEGFTYTTDINGVWTSDLQGINADDGLPYVIAVAVGPASAARLGYKPTLPGHDSILSGPPLYASATFTLEEGVTKQLGPIGVCPLPTVHLPLVMR
jgi:hypothetical protein